MVGLLWLSVMVVVVVVVEGGGERKRESGLSTLKMT